MKKEFFDLLYKLISIEKEIYVIFVGLGYPRVSEFLKKYPDRAFNVEASEQTALDMAVGLTLRGKFPIVYTITPFLFRGFETIRSYINYYSLPVVMVGAGRDDEYSLNDGHSHYAGDMKRFMDQFENIEQYYPEDKEALEMIIWKTKPVFINIRR